MKITNHLGLPPALVSAVSTERHNAEGRYSATTLLKGNKEILLGKRHHDELTQDASDSIWAVFGTAVHSIFEKQEDDTFKEEFFEVPVSKSIVTGKIDSYDMENQMIVDWKTASIWKIQFNDFEDWRKQGLIYAWLLKRQGLEVKKCRFIALLKDHSKSKARRDSSYPQNPVFVYEFELTKDNMVEIEKFIYKKIYSLESDVELTDDDIAPCSASERWASPTKYAVMKEGRKTAVRLLESEDEAENLAESLGKAHFVEVRKGESRKCADYCMCKDFCSFYKEEQE